MKRTLAVLLLSLIGMGFAQVKIGILSPLTGAAAGTGQAQLAGFELAIEEINAAGGVLGEPLEIIVEDTKADPATAVAAFEKLMTEDGVEFIGGGYSSGVTLALVESFRTFQPLVSWIGGATSGIGIDGFDGIEELIGTEPWFFHVHPWDYQNTQASSQFAVFTGANTVALLHENSAFGGPGAQAAAGVMVGSGQEVVLVEPFQSTLTGGNGDFRAVLSKVAAADPDMIFWIGYDGDVVPLTSQIRELNLDPQYVFGAPPGWPSEFDSAPEAQCVAGLIGYLPNLPNPEAVTFRDSYVAMHGSNPTNYMSALAYAQLWSYADAINQAGTTDQAAVIEAMESMTFDSPMGQWSFGPSEITQHQGFSADMWLAFQFQDGVREIVWPPEKATAPLVSCQ